MHQFPGSPNLNVFINLLFPEKIFFKAYNGFPDQKIVKEFIVIPLVFMLVMMGLNFPESTAQEKTDTLLLLPPVQVEGIRFFESQTTGMKKTRIDTLILQQKSHFSLSGLLAENSPVFIKSHGRGALATASFRGTSSTHTSVYWNGIEIGSPLTGMTDFSLIPVYITDEMIVNHGSASLPEGSGGGLGGSISLNNQPVLKKHFKVGLLQGVGSYQTFDEFGYVSWGKENMHSRTRVYYNYSKNDYPFTNRIKLVYDQDDQEYVHPRERNSNADYRRYGVLQELYLQPSASDLISFQWWSQFSNRSIPRVLSFEGAENANIRESTNTDHRVSANWKKYVNEHSFEWISAFNYSDINYFLKNQVSGLGLVPAIFSESGYSNFQNRLSYKFEKDDRRVIQARFNGGWMNVSTRDTVVDTGYDETRADFSLMFSWNESLSDVFDLHVLLRQDLIDEAFSPLIPFLGFSWQLFPDFDLRLKGNASRSFNYPSLNDLYWQPGGNPDLNPETGWVYEAGLGIIPVSTDRMELKSEITFYHSEISDWILWLPGLNGFWEPQNIREVRSRGIDINVDMKTTMGAFTFSGFATYACTDVVNLGDPLVWGDNSYGKQLVYIPLHSGNFFLNLQYKNYTIGYQYNAYSERYTTTSNEPNSRNWLYPYFMNDLTFSRLFELDQLNVSASFKIYNLFNETYHSILFRPMPGRNFMFSLKVDWNIPGKK